MEVIIKRKAKNYSKDDDNNEKTRVVAYTRVSTDEERQLGSFESQKKYYYEKITSNPEWIFKGIYGDEGISGTSSGDRAGFINMIRDAKSNKFDLILTKSISRFARNTLDTLKYVRELKANGVAILFEEENINTMDMAGELLLTVLSSVAQQESETISSHIKLGLKMKMERGEVVGNISCYGLSHNSKEKTVTIIESEAKWIKYIYEQYLKGYGSHSIAHSLTNMNVPTPGGGSNWLPTTVTKILKNEKYIGDVIMGKYYTVDSITHKRVKNNGEMEKYILRDHHQPIISREDFEEVQEIMQGRSRTYLTGRKKISSSSFSGKMRCGFCGNSYSRRYSQWRVAWACSTAIKGNKTLCLDSKIIPDDVIKSTFAESYYLLTVNNGLAIDEFISAIKETIRSDAPEVMSSKYIEDRKKQKAKLSKLIDLYVEDQIEKNVYERKRKTIEDRIHNLTAKIESLECINEKENKLDFNLEKIRNDLMAREAANQIQPFDKNVFDSLIDYIIIGGVDENEKPNGFIIRFICKTGLYSKSRTDITESTIIENGLNKKEDNIYTPIIDFISTQKISYYEVIDNRRVKKIIDKVRVRVEIEK